LQNTYGPDSGNNNG